MASGVCMSYLNTATSTPGCRARCRSKRRGGGRDNTLSQDEVGGELADIVSVLSRYTEERPRRDVAPGNGGAARGFSEGTLLDAQLLRRGVDHRRADHHGVITFELPGYVAGEAAGLAD